MIVAPPLRVMQAADAPFATRDARAHRRQTWQTRFARNQRRPNEGCRLRIHGVPASLEDLLGIPHELPRVA